MEHPIPFILKPFLGKYGISFGTPPKQILHFGRNIRVNAFRGPVFFMLKNTVI